jgi:aspartyl aminopeptidase
MIEIIEEVKRKLQTDTDIIEFCKAKYNKEVTVKTGQYNINDVPIREMPVIVISFDDESEKRKLFLYEIKTNYSIVCGILNNDIEKAEGEIITLKELIKKAIKKDPLLSKLVTYSVITRSKRIETITHPIYFMQLTLQTIRE